MFKKLFLYFCIFSLSFSASAINISLQLCDDLGVVEESCCGSDSDTESCSREENNNSDDTKDDSCCQTVSFEINKLEVNNTYSAPAFDLSFFSFVPQFYRFYKISTIDLSFTIFSNSYIEKYGGVPILIYHCISRV